METAAIAIESVFLAVLFLITYTYLIYPGFAMVIGAGSLRKTDGNLPPISVLVAAHNEASIIAEKIENFRALDYPEDRIELVIADDGSDDGTSLVVREHLCKRVQLLQQPIRGGKAAAMNRLADSAKHPLLLFTDANVMLARNSVRRLVDHLADDRVGAITGEVRLIGSGREFSVGEAVYYWIERRIQGAESRIGSVMGVDGGMYLLRRCLFQQLPEDTILDDFLVSMNVMRSGHRVVYEGAAKATESGTPTAQQEFSRRIRIAAGAVQLLKRGNVPRPSQGALWLQFISHKLLRWLSPILFTALLACNLMLVDRGAWYIASLGTQSAAYFLVIAGLLLPALRRSAAGSVLFYFGASQAAMAVGLCRGLLNRQAPQWEKGCRTPGDETGSSGS